LGLGEEVFDDVDVEHGSILRIRYLAEIYPTLRCSGGNMLLEQLELSRMGIGNCEMSC